MPNHNITKKEWLLVGFIILMGWFFSMKDTILKFDSMSPNQLFLISYAVLYGFLYIASKYHGGIIIWNFQIKHPLQVFGTVLIIFSVFLVTTWENPYIQYVTKGNFDGISNIFYATEDGITWNFWTRYIEPIPENIEKLRLLTFVFTPGLLSLIGVYLLNKKPEF